MSAIQFHTTSKGNLTHLYNIFHKPEPLGEGFKTVDLYVTGSLILFEIHRGEDRMKLTWYHFELVATAACTNILMDYTKGLGMRSLKRSTGDFVYGI